MRLFKLLGVLAFLAAVCGQGYSKSISVLENGVIIERTTYKFPSYEQALLSTDVAKYASKTEYDTAVADHNFEFEKLKYVSEGLKVTAYLYRPQRIERNLPTIIFNRGSAVRGDIAPELVSFFHRLAGEGFIVLAPMLRQSDGGEGRDELGGADVNDLMNIIPVARALRFVDMDNLFMYGESRGGMMTYQACRENFPINAAAVFGAFTDLPELVNSHPKQYSPELFRKLWPDYETHQDALFKTRSAIHWPDQLKVPLLIMHGGADQGVNPEQSLRLAQELQKLGRVYELIIYAEDGHILSRNQADRDRRAAGWFKRFIKK